jgi:hypothetical protein
LWDDVTVGDDARLTECVVADGVCILPGTRFERVAIVPAEGRTTMPGDEIRDQLLATPIAGAGPSARGIIQS